ncbi:MAG TPA: hypothetical protein ENN13_01840 [Candidatus Altiarchaeales archaeon]|nr:hypothetical protein [Candidatus Altiarchaeales archaeon]
MSVAERKRHIKPISDRNRISGQIPQPAEINSLAFENILDFRQPAYENPADSPAREKPGFFSRIMRGLGFSKERLEPAEEILEFPAEKTRATEKRRVVAAESDFVRARRIAAEGVSLKPTLIAWLLDNPRLEKALETVFWKEEKGDTLEAVEQKIDTARGAYDVLFGQAKRMYEEEPDVVNSRLHKFVEWSKDGGERNVRIKLANALLEDLKKGVSRPGFPVEYDWSIRRPVRKRESE